MNYLAHLFLAGSQPQSIVGNLVADFVKGAALTDLPAGIQAGIRMHRAVDAFTDKHPVVRESKARFGKRWARVSGILVDVYYDHFLARHWEDYSQTGLRQTLDAAYEAIGANLHYFTPETRASASFLIESDLMMTYTRIEGIELALTRLSRRLRHGQFELQESVAQFAVIEAPLANDFRVFFPELVQYSTDLINMQGTVG